MGGKLRLLVVVFVLLLRGVVCCWGFCSEELALLGFRDRVESDPYGVLASWKSGEDPCSWFGVGCSGGKVVTLKLKSLSLRGELAPQLGQLTSLKYLILSNNSFYGRIPSEIGRLKQLEVLDLDYNNFNGRLPSELQNLMMLKYLIVTNNKFLDSKLTQIDDKSTYNELSQKEKNGGAAREVNVMHISTSREIYQMEATATKRRLLQNNAATLPFEPMANGANDLFDESPSSAPKPATTISLPPSPNLDGSIPSPAPTPTETPHSPSPSPPPSPDSAPINPVLNGSAPSPTLPSTPSSSSRHHVIVYISIAIGASVLTLFAIVFLSCQRNKVVTVRPWVTGLSGQLQKAFVTGVPRLRRSELEAACEDFSNIIGTLLDSTLYKGTLSTGVEIAVLSNSITDKKEWSRHLEAQFRNKIETLSKVNHKNFVNLIGYCEEETPFTRMMVFEYAPNGTLFEHLHVRESERLDWPARLRIAMGMGYCLEHLHQLNPPITHRSLNTAAIYLTDDFAAKISDFGLANADEAVRMGSGHSGLLTTSSNRENNVYDFGLVLLELLTGKRVNPTDERPLVYWAEDYLRGIQPVRLMVDPTLASFSEAEAIALCEVINSCFNPIAKQRPTMNEILVQLRQITAITPDGAIPKLNPLWWAELEIISTEAS